MSIRNKFSKIIKVGQRKVDESKQLSAKVLYTYVFFLSMSPRYMEVLLAVAQEMKHCKEG